MIWTMPIVPPPSPVLGLIHVTGPPVVTDVPEPAWLFQNRPLFWPPPEPELSQAERTTASSSAAPRQKSRSSKGFVTAVPPHSVHSSDHLAPPYRGSDGLRCRHRGRACFPPKLFIKSCFGLPDELADALGREPVLLRQESGRRAGGFFPEDLLVPFGVSLGFVFPGFAGRHPKETSLEVALQGMEHRGREDVPGVRVGARRGAVLRRSCFAHNQSTTEAPASVNSAALSGSGREEASGPRGSGLGGIPLRHVRPQSLHELRHDRLDVGDRHAELLHRVALAD